MELQILAQLYHAGLVETKNECIRLVNLAMGRHRYTLAREVLEDLHQCIESRSSRYTGRPTKTLTAQVQECLRYCQRMEELKAAQGRAPQAGRSPSENLRRMVQTPVVQSAGPEPAGTPVQPPPAQPPEEELPELKVAFEIDPASVIQSVESHRVDGSVDVDLAIRAYRLSFRTSYDQLICLSTLRDVRSLWHQEETARKVMKSFRGRAILADEVGLGKTVEAGLILKEYLMRGLAASALVLTPSSLVHQWREELSGKFNLAFATTNDPLLRENPGQFWSQPFIIASLQTARGKNHFDAVTARSHDIVIVDEAHHLKNRATLNWKLVNTIRKTFLLMLTATPVQNSLEELYNLVTLLRPGHLKTQKAFKEQFVARGSPTDPRNREMLRQLLKEVMVRNTRSVTQLQLPPRFATTVRTTPAGVEAAFYDAVSDFVAAQASQGKSAFSKLALKRLLEAVGSSHAAALRMIERMSEGSQDDVLRGLAEIIELGRGIEISGKAAQILDLVRASPDQKIIFVNYLATMEYIRDLLHRHRIPHQVYHGGMDRDRKQAAIEAFRGGSSVLLATGTGGEGHNLQFCHVMLNYDLPWNPMEIEQRIGRIHRIGQEREVQVYNFCAAGSIEDRILEILDRKINMFELVVGEVDMILGRLQGEEEFGDLVYDIWVTHRDEAERDRAFGALATKLQRARSSYEKSRELDEKLFQEDFGV
ncbi:MAG: DEAD/DEAH box helicase [Syntrophobacteraceae bacterium]|nr:DEAD/DEAH box helicase [Syntrophobacteraceae bacterium]